MKLEGKVAIITGGGGGIGRGISLFLAREGADVTLVYFKHPSLAMDTENEVRKIGRKALAIKADITKSNEIDHAIEETLNNFGRLDILVNSAGIVKIAPVLDIKEEEWDAIFNVNTKGVFLFSKAVAKYMISQRSGKIINVASDAGKTGEVLIAPYCASKFAVLGFTQAFALEMAPYNINVNAVCPCVCETDMMDYYAKEVGKLESRSLDEVKDEWASSVPLGRVATPDDVAKVVVFLASDDSNFITGQAINVTGGGVKKYCVGG